MHLLEPVELLSVHLRLAGDLHHQAPLQRPTAQLRQLDQHLAVLVLAHSVRDVARPADVAHAVFAQDLGQRKELLVRRHVGREEAPVLGAIFEALVRREAESPGVHALAEEALDLAALGRGELGALAGGLDPHHVGAQRRVGNQGRDVEAQVLAVQAVEVLREGDPVPAQAGAHGVHRDGLDAAHHLHVGLAVLRAGGREAEAALPDRQRRDPVPAGSVQ